MLDYLLSRLRTTDTNIMRASVIKLLEGTEKNHIDFFQSRKSTWDNLRRAKSLDVRSFLLTGFCDLLEKHVVGSNQFANFLVSWYNLVGSIAVHLLIMKSSTDIRSQIPELSGVG